MIHFFLKSQQCKKTVKTITWYSCAHKIDSSGHSNIKILLGDALSTTYILLILTTSCLPIPKIGI